MGKLVTFWADVSPDIILCKINMSYLFGEVLEIRCDMATPCTQQSHAQLSPLREINYGCECLEDQMLVLSSFSPLFRIIYDHI